MNYEQYLRIDKMPLIWCPGCGHGIIMKAVLRAIDKAGLDQDKTCMVSGIGCSSRLTGYVDFNTLHTTHGRAIAFASGIKMAKPEMNVIVITGDGDASSIGGNHLIHAARRNIDLTVILFNNQIYGMTGGQVSPTTPSGAVASTAPYGSFENNFDIPDLVKSAGASFVARGTAYHTIPLSNYIEKALRRHGFSLIEALSPCPTTFGRRNKQGDGVKMLQYQKEHTVSKTQAETMTAEALRDKYITGILVDIQKPECRDEYQKLINQKQHKGA